MHFKQEKCDLDFQLFFEIESYDGFLYICKTCDKKFRKNFIPCQAASKKLYITLLPREFRSLNRLERILVSKRILFKKVTVMPKGKSPKLKSSI